MAYRFVIVPLVLFLYAHINQIKNYSNTFGQMKANSVSFEIDEYFYTIRCSFVHCSKHEASIPLFFFDSFFHSNSFLHTSLYLILFIANWLAANKSEYLHGYWDWLTWNEFKQWFFTCKPSSRFNFSTNYVQFIILYSLICPHKTKRPANEEGIHRLLVKPLKFIFLFVCETVPHLIADGLISGEILLWSFNRRWSFQNGPMTVDPKITMSNWNISLCVCFRD